MANRITVAELKEIIDLDSTLTDDRITVFITQANLMTDAALSLQGLSEAVLKEIERNIAAHFIRALDPQAISERAGEVSVTYAGNFGEGLKGTHYGQMAMMLDTSGKLARAGQKRGSFIVVDYSTDLTG
jgi:hypothetical protein